MRARLLYCASNHSGGGRGVAAAVGGGRSLMRSSRRRLAAAPRGRAARGLGVAAAATAASRCAASIRASAIHRAIRSTSRSAQAPDVLEDHVGLDAVDDRERAVQADAHRGRHGRRQRRERVLEDADPVAAPIGLLVEQAGPLERPLLERELRRGAHLRLELLEARESLLEQLAHPRPAVGLARDEAAHRAERGVDHRRDQGAAAREVAVGGGARDLGAGRDLGHRGDVAVDLDQRHRRVEQQAKGRRLDAAGRRLRRRGQLMLETHHAGLSGAAEETLALVRAGGRTL